MSSFAERVKGLRKAAGLNQPELAAKVGVTKALISQIEQGAVQEVKMELLFRLSEVLAVSGRFLATGKGSPISLGGITTEEAELVLCFRHCSPEVQQQILATAKLFAHPKMPAPPAPKSERQTHK